MLTVSAQSESLLFFLIPLMPQPGFKTCFHFYVLVSTGLRAYALSLDFESAEAAYLGIVTVLECLGN